MRKIILTLGILAIVSFVFAGQMVIHKTDGTSESFEISEIEMITFEDIDTSLVAYYPFNGNADDESGNGNNGTVYGATLTEDRFGNDSCAYYFDGENDYIFVTDSDILDLTTEGTIMGWINIPSAFSPPFGGTGLVNKMLHSSIFPSYDFMIGHTASFGAGISDGENCLHIYSINTPSDSMYNDTWHLLTFTWDSENLSLYFDDNLDNSIVNITNGAQITDWDVYIGRRAYASSTNWKYFEGKIDDIHLYNRALSETEIQNLYYEGGWPLKY